MVELMQKPFVAEVEGHEVSLTQDNCAIMMESSAVRAITDSLFFAKDTQDKTNQTQQNKRQRTNNATVRTECGATGIVALHQTTQRNSWLNKQAIQNSINKLDKEKKNITTTLTALAALKVKRPEDAYWVFSMQLSQLELSMILHLLAPQSGRISKGKQEMWRYIEENLLSMLSQAAVDAKGEEYSCRLAVVMEELAMATEELAALNEEEQQVEDAPVQIAKDGSGPDDPCEDMIDQEDQADDQL